MKINFTEIAWNDYIYWQGQDKKTLKRINKLIQDVKGIMMISKKVIYTKAFK